MHNSEFGADTLRSDVTSGRKATLWVGWLLFAGAMMTLVGAFHAIAGVMALIRRDYFVVAPDGLVVQVSYTSWGWVHLLAGVVTVFAGIGVIRGQKWARVFGMVLAGLGALLNFAFLPAYPVWCTVMIAIDVLVIYALAVHGDEVRALG
ncbi:DUF7144 family membrane protein [Allokutzneria albata]|uniref:DUF7144 domain-containing protein n=1 Tax=Allokutzneria albata TaxID=211114 RepID=A0A1G9R5S6_ALLAB|nr:hypothetical protein [Allokutzneria albata]SDM18639.1 hypothetical protein SAMN04489726_0244 [Allokutzneria albata]